MLFRSACPACFGEKDCVLCAGDRRVRLGDEAAARQVQRARIVWQALTDADGEEGLHRILRRDEERLVKRFSGTLEAGLLPFWPEARLQAFASGPLPVSSGGRAAVVSGRTLAAAARARVERVLQALRR